MTDDLQKKVDRAVRLLQAVAKGYDGEIEVGYSGGKDSDVILHLARRAGIKIRPIYHNTTIDPPGTIAHVEEVGGGTNRASRKVVLPTHRAYPRQSVRLKRQAW